MPGDLTAATEREPVYEELKRVQRKCYRLKQEVARLRSATSAQEAATVRMEAAAYRRALSNIAYRLEHGNGFISHEMLQSIVSGALLLRGLKARDRRRIERAREGDER